MIEYVLVITTKTKNKYYLYESDIHTEMHLL